MKQIENTRVAKSEELPTPKSLAKKYKMTRRASNTIFNSRRIIQNILLGLDKRFLIFLGPCSFHDEKAFFEFVLKAKKLREETKDRFFFVVRGYFEKPRTIFGWPGFLYDPHIDGSYDAGFGLDKTTDILLKTNDMEMPLTAEILDILTSYYIAKFLSHGSIGARTVEYQSLRKLASGSSPVIGVKNSTEGNINVAIDAVETIRRPHCFFGINEKARLAKITTIGNDAHVILRGGRNAPNYDAVSINGAITELVKRSLNPSIVVDCSHKNSQQNPDNQIIVAKSVMDQRNQGNNNIVGIMLESNLFDGNQSIPKNPRDLPKLKYGVSITDPCLGWDKTEKLLGDLYDSFSI